MRFDSSRVSLGSVPGQSGGVVDRRRAAGARAPAPVLGPRPQRPRHPHTDPFQTGTSRRVSSELARSGTDEVTCGHEYFVYCILAFIRGFVRSELLSKDRQSHNFFYYYLEISDESFMSLERPRGHSSHRSELRRRRWGKMESRGK
ncbi:hypothetical protein EVAR_43348_1 [Eumeta japonica]|uniref:Uncharacterized protein n=1 Tax=Eumeta variegata TaxID=151549 RepID=A0A4C1WR89_EUMVA|nr:hypothetical protein EVAR_43348_1 [Eumeta japonica]